MVATDFDIRLAYADYDRQIGLGRIRVGVWLAMILLPVGAIADIFVYPTHVAMFFPIRCAAAALMSPFLLLIRTDWGQRNYRALGVVLAMCPALCMIVLIALADGAPSTYYAGLNLVLLTIGLVLRWTLIESLIGFTIVILLYAAVCWTPPGAVQFKFFFNNLYFLVLTGSIVVTGNHLQSQLRFREFASNHQLDLSRRELEKSNKRLMELDELKGRFFANVSHELRTPLTLLIAPLESLRTRIGASVDAQSRDWLDIMYGNGMRLLKLINDLLDLVRLDTGRLQLDVVPIVPGDFFRGLLNSVKSAAQEKGIKLDCDVESSLPVIYADLDKMEKVFLNLLFNSVKFTPAGGSIRILARAEGDHAVIQVIDTGMGVTAENAPHIFNRFWQADTSANRKFQGTGIGLALVKELVEAHHGTVEVRSQPGAGTTMVVTIPIGTAKKSTTRTSEFPGTTSPGTEVAANGAAVAPGPEIIAHASSASGEDVRDGIGHEGGEPENAWMVSLYQRARLFSGIPQARDALRVQMPVGTRKRARLLIAEDEADMLRFLKSQLDDQYEVIEAVDGDQAVTLATQYLPEVILCDMMLPEKDGLQVCRELRARTSTKALPLLMLTARADDETKLQALAAGANDFLTKPFSSTELRLRIKNLVETHKLQQQLEWQNQKLEATNEDLKDALEELKSTEVQLVQGEKMASLGRLSAGIIHEINNPLNFARTGLHLLSRQARHIPKSERVDYDETIKDIQDGITRVAGIVSDLRGFTHPHGGGTEDVDVRSCVDAALRFLVAELKDRVTVSIDIPAGMTLRSDRNKLIQVFNNLLQNSSDALKPREVTEDGEPARIKITGEEAADGRRFLRFWDNGSGISASNLGKVFDPFFTTKDVGDGTGLGLSITYRIVREAGGHITVQSEEGRFCEFSLEFGASVPEKSPEKSPKTEA
ncbi:MAG: response regulator [Pedosphaera sp.]|nr:response regulator [Pedosphaera sp.]